MSLPYYKRFPRDFLEGTIGLSFQAKGAYAIVLDLIYMRDGRLAADHRYIAGQLNCSVRKWTAILRELVDAGKLVVENGIISNFRANYLLEETRKFQDKQAENATKPRENSALAEPKASHTESEPDTEDGGGGERARDPEPSPIIEQQIVGPEPPDDWPSGRPLDHLVGAVGSPRLDPAKSPGLVTTAGRLAAWKRAGASWEHDVVPVVTALCAKQRGPISTWKFFDQAIARSIADNRAALEIPLAQPRATGPPLAPSLTDRIAAERAEARRIALQDG